MLSVASVIVALAGAAVLALLPLPKKREKRLLQQAAGTILFTAGIGSFVALVFMGGKIVG